MLGKAETLLQLRNAIKGKSRPMGHLSDVVIEKAYMDERKLLYVFPKDPGIFYRAEPIATFGTDDIKQIIKHIEKHGVA